MRDAITFGSAKTTRGVDLHPDDKRQVLAAYVHRHMHAMRKLSDLEWLASTWFAVKTNGRLHGGFKHCETNHPDFEATRASKDGAQ